MFRNLLCRLNGKADKQLSQIYGYLHKNKNLILVLSFIVLFAYGFELFNLNLTIDEEISAASRSPSIGWLRQGRWGMYFLNTLLLPYNVLPVVPLATALFFHLISALLMFESWNITDITEQITIGAVFLTFPGLAYVYTFSTLNYGVGIGFFFVFLSLFLYLRNIDKKKYYAALPAGLALAIYQPFVLALVAVYLISFMILLLEDRENIFVNIIEIVVVFILASGIYGATQRIFLYIYKESSSGYVESFFSLRLLIENFNELLKKFIQMLNDVYLGEKIIYGIEIPMLKVLLLIVLLVFLKNVFSRKISYGLKILLLSFFILLLFVPFLAGFLMNGVYLMRALIGVPVVLAGMVFLGFWVDDSPLCRIVIVVIALASVYQFSASLNRLFASSHLALEADRLFASRLIERIEDVIGEVNEATPPRYMEVVGYLDREPTEIIPRSSTFGASFFDWNGGNTNRMLFFMTSVGFQDLIGLPRNRRIEFVEVAVEMPAWPAQNSVQVVSDTVLVKLGPYSYPQKQVICASDIGKEALYQDFCP